jgi:S-adenosylmethionine/arginine decarboxylase-like enzyme
MLEHHHLIIRAEILRPPLQPEVMDQWMTNLVKDIDMKLLGGPYTVYSKMVGNRGMTSVAIIETSHIACHIWDEENPAVMQLDIYSCSDFAPGSVIDLLDAAFDIVSLHAKRLERDNGVMEVPLQWSKKPKKVHTS